MKIPFVTRTNAQKILAKKINKHIEIVGSSNPRLNAMAKDAQLSMLAVLRAQYTHVGVTIVDTMSDLERLIAKKPDLVVLGMKLILLEPSKGYDDSPKLWLSNYLETYDIDYTGSDTVALALEFDKPEAKQVVIDAGLKSSAYFISSIKQPTFSHNLRYPLFVKPTNRGDSKGIDEMSVVHTQSELEHKIRSIHKECSSDVLIEEYLSGREFSVAVIRQAGSGELLAMPIEISAPADNKGNRFLSEVVKGADTEEVLAVTDAALKQTLNALAIGVFTALGSRDYGRIDMRLDTLGVPSFIEANLMPGLSDHGYLTRCFALNEIGTYKDMILSIVALGFQRARSIHVEVPASLLAQAPEHHAASYM
jgi:D-alanine-D-alanine ligase